MAYTTISKSTDHFNTKLYTGTGSSMSVTGVGFRPDWLWIKTRNAVNSSHIVDVVRGNGQAIASDLTNAQYSSGVTSFDSDGFSLVGNTGAVNNGNGSTTYVAWNWLAGGSQGSSNTDGSINTTYTSVNTTSGFSISTYTGTGATATVGHGIGKKPKVVLIKGTSNTGTWGMYHSSIGATKKILLNSNAAQVTSGWMNNTEPTNQVFTVINDSDVGTSGYTYIAYAFAEKKGFSKFGKYLGNTNNDGPFVYTGFRPSVVFLKEIGSTSAWFAVDNARAAYGGNPNNRFLRPNSNDEETDSSWHKINFCSNGFKIEDDDVDINDSSYNYLYMAFAEAPLVGSNNEPCKAR